MENNILSPKEKYEEEKREREMRRKEVSISDVRPRQMNAIAKTIGWIGGVAVVVLGFWFWIQSTLPQTEDVSQTFPLLVSPHIPDDSAYPEYNSNPPTSGPHYVQPARPGFRGEEDIVDEHFVHSLEHGSVWVSYQSDVPTAFVDILRDIAKGDSKVVVSKRDANDLDIAIASWTQLDTFDLSGDSELDRARIEDFITRYKNRGPEQVNDTHGGV